MLKLWNVEFKVNLNTRDTCLMFFKGNDTEMSSVYCSGTAILSGYSKEISQVDFVMEEWLPIIENINDWEFFNL